MLLTKEEAAGFLKLDNLEDYPTLDIILPAIDDVLKTATGKDWGANITNADGQVIEKDPTAKMVASVLLVRWFDDPGMIGQINDSNIIGFVAQLKAKVL